MKNILFITSTPTTHGNGDTLIEAAMEAAKEQGGQCDPDEYSGHGNPSVQSLLWLRKDRCLRAER